MKFEKYFPLPWKLVDNFIIEADNGNSPMMIYPFNFSIDGENIVNIINGNCTSDYTDVRYNNKTQIILANNEPILSIMLLRNGAIDCDINDRLEILNELTSWVVNKLGN